MIDWYVGMKVVYIEYLYSENIVDCRDLNKIQENIVYTIRQIAIVDFYMLPNQVGIKLVEINRDVQWRGMPVQKDQFWHVGNFRPLVSDKSLESIKNLLKIKEDA